MSSSTEETSTAWSKYSAGRRSQRITNSRPDMALPASAASTSTTSSTSTTTPGVSSFKQKLLAKKRQDQVAAPKKATSKPTTPVAASGSVSDSKSGREKTQRPPADKVSASSSNDPKKSTERSKEVPKAAVSRPASTASAEDPLSLNRPFTLPSGEFRPKQSLGQNYLSDQNYINKIIDTFHSERTAAMKRDKQAGVDVQEDPSGKRVVEIGPGAGALTRSLSHRFKDMLAVEIDQRAVALLNDKIPKLNVLHQDVLQFDWAKHSMERDGKLSIVANLPYHIVSQVRIYSLYLVHFTVF